MIPATLGGFGFVRLAQLFYPAVETQSLVGLVAAPCEMLLAGWLAVRRWNANYGRVSQ